MNKKGKSQPTIIRTSRGLSIAGTRITIYSVMDYVKAGWPKKLIRERLNLTEKQIADVMDYIETHRQEVETEYESALQSAKQIRKYWETRNQKLLSKVEVMPNKTKQQKIRAKLRARKEKLRSA